MNRRTETPLVQPFFDFSVIARIVLALSVLALGVAFAPPVRGARDVPEVIEPQLQRPTPELAREWLWEKKAVSFDHMYRKQR